MAEAQGDQDGVGLSRPPAPTTTDPVAGTLEYLARWIVDHQDDVRVEQRDGERGPIYRLHVHPDDLGRVIGRGGRVARAIRQVVRAAAARAQVFATVEIDG